MASHARRGPSALRLEVLEPRVLLSGVATETRFAAIAGPSVVVLVRFAAEASPATIEADVAAAGGRVVQELTRGLYRVGLGPGVDETGAIRQLEHDPDVVYAEADATFRAQAQSRLPPIGVNDPASGMQWGLNQAGKVDIDAPQAWGRTTGSRSIIVAVLDSGIDLSNPEFAGRIWTNPDPSGSDGHAGDVHGWNFVSNNADVQDDDGHGTHVAGIIAASANNGLGVAGVDWNAQVMPLKVLDSSGNGTNAGMVSAIEYAVRHGARVINASWGGGEYSRAVADAISDAGNHGVVFVTVAGNDGTNNDNHPFYPASYRLPNEIVVAAVGEQGTLPAFSDYGARTVDLAAPGVNIVSTMPGGGYAYMTGTSMAAPYVSGVVSLVAGLHPTYGASQVVQQVLSTTKPLPGLAGKTVTGGIVDAARAVGIGRPEGRGAGGWHLAGYDQKVRPLASPLTPAPGGPGRRRDSTHPNFRIAHRPRNGAARDPRIGTAWPPRRAAFRVGSDRPRSTHVSTAGVP